MRQVLDENLSDAVLYARGFNNNIIGQTVAHALESFYVGEFDPAPGAAGKEVRRRAPTVFLTESLGSIILAEAMVAHANELSAATKAEKRSGMRDVLRNLETVYMMANQIALLDMPSPDPSGAVVPGPQPRAFTPASVPNQTHATFHAFAQARRQVLGEPDSPAPMIPERPAALPPKPAPLMVAAFNDLYDTLSYRVSPDSLPESDVRIDNFYPRNAGVLLWPFKLYEDMDKAHTTYGANADVIKVVMEGYRPEAGR